MNGGQESIGGRLTDPNDLISLKAPPKGYINSSASEWLSDERACTLGHTMRLELRLYDLEDSGLLLISLRNEFIRFCD